jgi:hypothetical protein
VNTEKLRKNKRRERERERERRVACQTRIKRPELNRSELKKNEIVLNWQSERSEKFSLIAVKA